MFGQSRKCSDVVIFDVWFFVHFVFKAEILIDTLAKKHKMVMIMFDRLT